MLGFPSEREHDGTEKDPKEGLQQNRIMKNKESVTKTNFLNQWVNARYACEKKAKLKTERTKLIIALHDNSI